MDSHNNPIVELMSIDVTCEPTFSANSCNYLAYNLEDSRNEGWEFVQILKTGSPIQGTESIKLILGRRKNTRTILG